MSQADSNTQTNHLGSIHILGIAGTFMGGIAQLAKAKGFKVSGSDQAVYPPMSTQLEQAGISFTDEADVTFLESEPTQVVIGNAKSRGHKQVEATLNHHQRYTSGPQWLAENILQDRWVVAVAGTHGKTSTSSMIAWILEYAGLNPGFLIGGVPENFGVSAKLGASPFFVVEADEYDTAFFDKRSKFVHYHPRTCVLNNLEFDHADIFDSVADIQRQFHHLVRTVPGNGLIVMPDDDSHIAEVIEKGCWTTVEKQGCVDDHECDWTYENANSEKSSFGVCFKGSYIGNVNWSMNGEHNIRNALSAIAAAVHCGVPAYTAIEALCEFKGIRRRMTLVGEVNEVKVYDDFAHHPTAIASTLSGARANLDNTNPDGRLIAVFEPRSNTMRLGIHEHTLPEAFNEADAVFAYIDPAWHWSLDESKFKANIQLASSYESLLVHLKNFCEPNDTVVIMSNGGFGGIHHKLLDELVKVS